MDETKKKTTIYFYDDEMISPENKKRSAGETFRSAANGIHPAKRTEVDAEVKKKSDLALDALCIGVIPYILNRSSIGTVQDGAIALALAECEPRLHVSAGTNDAPNKIDCNGHLFNLLCLARCPRSVAWVARRMGCDGESIKNVAYSAFCYVSNFGRREPIEWMVETFDLTGADIRKCCRGAFPILCASGHTEVAKWFVERFGLTREMIVDECSIVFERACEEGHPEIVEWLYGLGCTFRYFCFGSRHPLLTTCAAGHIDVLRFLEGKLMFSAKLARSEGNYALKAACVNEHRRVAEWLVARFGFTADDAGKVGKISRTNFDKWSLGSHHDMDNKNDV